MSKSEKKKDRKEKKKQIAASSKEEEDDVEARAEEETKKSMKEKKKKSKKMRRKEAEQAEGSGSDKGSKKRKLAVPAASAAQPLKENSSSDKDVEQSKSADKKKKKNKKSKNDHQSTANTDQRIVATSALDFHDETVIQQQTKHQPHNTSLVLFYQYVEPPWTEELYQEMLTKLTDLGKQLNLTGRMRVAREGLNCTLTGTNEAIPEYCNTLRTKLHPEFFQSTEFKVTKDLPQAQRFPNLKVFPVVELVHYGLEGKKAPPIAKFQGTHLEPKEYHTKLAENNTVVIDVRNHYEAAIGRFCPPTDDAAYNNNDNGQSAKSSNGDDSGDQDDGQKEDPPEWLDPKMRKSTEFPAWLNRPETKEKLKGKQVLMYCTGGIRCERASALLKYKMESDPDIKDLNIKGVYQLQGGIDKYFKEFPEGGYWKGKNYVFDKRFSHAPPKVDGANHARNGEAPPEEQIMGNCEACQKPWDMYRGKRRCPTCGVPSLICKDCFLADKNGVKKLGRDIRCDLCVEQGISSKRQWKEQEKKDIKSYEQELDSKGLLRPAEGVTMVDNPNNITRLHLKNMCTKNMDDTTLLESIPGITHIVWRNDGKSGKFLGQGWLEMASPDDAARAVARSGTINLFRRPLHIAFQAPGGKDAWPPPSSRVV